jgi:hypothetical protein
MNSLLGILLFLCIGLMLLYGIQELSRLGVVMAPMLAFISMLALVCFLVAVKIACLAAGCTWYE